ncbi:MAG: hypothetical protein QXF82_10365, partial [Nitrososphaeria archaeon]
MNIKTIILLSLALISLLSYPEFVMPHRSLGVSAFTTLTVNPSLNNVALTGVTPISILRNVIWIRGAFTQTGPESVTCNLPVAVKYAFVWKCIDLICYPTITENVQYGVSNNIQGWLGFPAGGGAAGAAFPPYLFDAVEA